MTQIRLDRLRPYVIAGAVIGLPVAAIYGLQLRPVLPEGGLIWHILTGALLAGLIAAQFLLPAARAARDSGAAQRQLKWHRIAGVAMLLVFSAHAGRSGHVWTSALTIAFFTVALTGLLNKDTLKFQSRVQYLAWFFIHAAAASLLVALALFHIWIALVYE